jgi:hypothetical protein
VTTSPVLASLLLLIGATGSVRADCVPTAVPVGDASVVSAVTARLTASGIATTPRAGCPSVRVNVERRGESVHLRVVDAFERLGEREVRDIATAAAIIESWTLQEIDPGAPPETAVRVAPVVTATGSWFGAAGRSAIGDDGSTWLGGALGGCRRIGPTCAGGSLGISAETTLVEDISTGSHRSLAIDAAVTLALPRRLGSFTASPGISIGYGWNRIQQQHFDMHTMPLSISYANHALRTGAQLTVARRVGKGIAIFGELFGDIAAVRTEIPDGPRARAGLSLGARFEAP